MGEQLAPVVGWLLVFNTGLIAWRQALRVACVWPLYGGKFALLAPLRAVWGNVVNCAATVRALALFVKARARQEQPQWLKTEHSYPTRQGLRGHKRRLGEVLEDMGMVPPEAVEAALRRRNPGERVGEYLVRTGAVSEVELYRALGTQQSLPFELVAEAAVEAQALERVPRELAERLQVIPVRVTHERYLWVAGPELPTDTGAAALSEGTGLEARFVLMTPSNFRSLWPMLDRLAGRAASHPVSARHPGG